MSAYGCLLEIEEGCRGSVQAFDIDWIEEYVNPSEIVQMGDIVEVMVL
ncbi:hypothetical protein IT781_17645 [Methylobacter sp. BlB1]|nr:hypothetical protein [Methylobacter sp. BlB1]